MQCPTWIIEAGLFCYFLKLLCLSSWQKNQRQREIVFALLIMIEDCIIMLFIPIVFFLIVQRFDHNMIMLDAIYISRSSINHICTKEISVWTVPYEWTIYLEKI